MSFDSILIVLEKVISLIAIKLFVDLREYFLVSQLQRRPYKIVYPLKLLDLVLQLKEIPLAQMLVQAGFVQLEI
jgi:hypothetical protein